VSRNKKKSLGDGGLNQTKMKLSSWEMWKGGGKNSLIDDPPTGEKSVMGQAGSKTQGEFLGVFG